MAPQIIIQRKNTFDYFKASIKHTRKYVIISNTNVPHSLSTSLSLLLSRAIHLSLYAYDGIIFYLISFALIHVELTFILVHRHTHTHTRPLTDDLIYIVANAKMCYQPEPRLHLSTEH